MVNICAKENSSSILPYVSERRSSSSDRPNSPISLGSEIQKETDIKREEMSISITIELSILPASFTLPLPLLMDISAPPPMPIPAPAAVANRVKG